jgi:hypothetical protein
MAIVPSDARIMRGGRSTTATMPMNDPTLRKLAKAISWQDDRRKTTARAKVNAPASDLGYTLAERVGVDAQATRARQGDMWAPGNPNPHRVGPRTPAKATRSNWPA